MFNVGDKIRENWNGPDANIYTVTRIDNDMYGHKVYYSRSETSWDRGHNLNLVEPSVCLCTTSPAEVVQESYVFSYVAECDSGTDTASSTLFGDKAGDIVEVLNVFRGFLKSAGFNWVAEVNVTAEDGTWHSSSSSVIS